jgi:hypothetical protein
MYLQKLYDFQIESDKVFAPIMSLPIYHAVICLPSEMVLYSINKYTIVMEHEDTYGFLGVISLFTHYL